MASYNKFQQFAEDMPEKVHNLGSDTLKIMLTLVAPVATNSVKADLTEIAAGNGYTAGGTAVTVTTSADAAGTYTLAANQVVFTASGTMADFRYAVLYNDTSTSDSLIAWWDHGSTVTLTSGQTFTVQFGSANPGTIFTMV
jgi:hypothetical protein